MPHHICSTCGESWDDAFELCPQDGTALGASPPRTRAYGERPEDEIEEDAWFTSPAELAILRSSESRVPERAAAPAEFDLSELLFPTVVDRNAQTRREAPRARLKPARTIGPSDPDAIRIFVGRKLKSAEAYSETGVFDRPMR